MALYDYRCDDDGVFEISRPLGTAPGSIACPVCTNDARRVFSSPLLVSTPPAVAAAIDHADKTRHEPDIVTSLPPRSAHKRTPILSLTPTLQKLPRP